MIGGLDVLNNHRKQSATNIRNAIITISDTRNYETDKSGKIIKRLLEDAEHVVEQYIIVSDEEKKIQSAVEGMLNTDEIDVILMNGGTGIAKRDVTIEAIRPFLDKELPGFGELFRYLSYELDIGSASILSRAVAGAAGNKVIFALPGSSGAVTLAMEKIILKEIGHLVNEVRKDL